MAKIEIEKGKVVSGRSLFQDDAMHVSAGGFASACIVSSGHLYVYSGGKADGTGVGTKGSLEIFAGGIASNTVLYITRGLMYLRGGSSLNTNVYSGSLLDVMSGGMASSNYISGSGALIKVSSGGTATAAAADELSFAPFDAGSLAGASVAGLAEPDGSIWKDLAGLA